MFQVELIVFRHKLPIKIFLILPVLKSHRLETPGLSLTSPLTFFLHAQSVSLSSSSFVMSLITPTYLSFRYHCYHSSLDLRAYMTVIPPRSLSLLPVLSLSSCFLATRFIIFKDCFSQVIPGSKSFHQIQTN